MSSNRSRRSVASERIAVDDQEGHGDDNDGPSVDAQFNHCLLKSVPVRSEFDAIGRLFGVPGLVQRQVSSNSQNPSGRRDSSDDEKWNHVCQDGNGSFSDRWDASDQRYYLRNGWEQRKTCNIERNSLRTQTGCCFINKSGAEIAAPYPDEVHNCGV